MKNRTPKADEIRLLPSAVALREAVATVCVEWAKPVQDSNDTEGLRAWEILSKAALRFADATYKIAAKHDASAKTKNNRQRQARWKKREKAALAMGLKRGDAVETDFPLEDGHVMTSFVIQRTRRDSSTGSGLAIWGGPFSGGADAGWVTRLVSRA